MHIQVYSSCIFGLVLVTGRRRHAKSQRRTPALRERSYVQVRTLPRERTDQSARDNNRTGRREAGSLPVVHVVTVVAGQWRFMKLKCTSKD